jgi:hypothetical protein
MSLVTSPPSILSRSEWEEFQALRKAITNNPASVCPLQQEQFSSFFVRSLAGKGDSPL